ncbi:hypothetical protein LCGC14_2870040 [marine sediment metagenome]|uniref:Uncharacterized protein n=1 Tax=marine sediment metagenome TaxID=412755 RepID=A0A0F8Y3F2_9ZZZZ
MRQHTSPRHTAHLQENSKAREVYVLRNRSNGKDIRLVIHRNPCIVCAEHLLECVWDNFRVLPNLNPQSDESPATPSDRPTGDQEPPLPFR